VSDPEPLPQYFIVRGVLHVSKDPKFSDPEFQQHCDWLLESSQATVTIDLSQVAYLQSPEIACLCRVLMKAREKKKAVDLRISPKVMVVLKRMNLHKLAGLHVPDEPGPAGSDAEAPAD
jgi:ABC-type transporter Mla MlaB component